MTARLEDLKPDALVQGLVGREAVRMVTAQMMGEACQVVYRDGQGNLHSQILFRDKEVDLELVSSGRRWSFEGDGDKFRLVSEAERIRLAYLFDPYLAVSSSTIDPLPHQISAVYEHMLPRQPMRYLLADDPGAGKTIMAGLLIKELLIRGELERCLIVAPGSLTEQWQDELKEKFELQFELLTRDLINATGLGNPFEQRPLLIARMDMLARDAELQARLEQAPEWDLVVCDESHRMSAHYFGAELKTTKRYAMGRRVGNHARNLLLMTATPHNGKEEDFQLFMALLDEDRFAGQEKDAVHRSDPTDLMRRLVKEDLYTFEGKKLFPERRSYTAQYELSPSEKVLYERVTEYVRDEMNRADRNANAEGGGKRRVNVGFALMTLQRRLASSPFAIHRSIERRHERLEARMKEERLLLQGRQVGDRLQLDRKLDALDLDDIENLYEEDTAAEIEETENAFIDNATSAQTLAELEFEIQTLKELEVLSKKVVNAGTDAKWQQLDRILDDPLMVDENGGRRKLVLFTEFKDTLTDLARKIRNRLGRDEAVVEIHGGVPRDRRRQVVHAFMNDPQVVVLLANDAAGEGVNLQRAHLMVNYDLPWNPNRLEQRFGRIHRIGQQEVCHLWNLLAQDTREGEVYIQLLEKLDNARKALGDKVFDVLGQLFTGRSLRELLMDAVRYNADPAVKARMQEIDEAVNSDHLLELLERRALVKQGMDTSKVRDLRQQMERAMARRIHPHYVHDFFLEAFRRLGGKAFPREQGRYEITHVSPQLLDRDQQIGMGVPVQPRYERICFEKEHVGQSPRAELVSPGHPLLEACISLIWERHGEVLGQGAVLIDDNDPGADPRLLVCLEHGLQDGRRNRQGQQQLISNRLQFLEISRSGDAKTAGSAPYLDYRPLREGERELIQPLLGDGWLNQDWDQLVLAHAMQTLVPEHLEEIRRERLGRIEKARQEIQARMQRQINHWSRQYEELKHKDSAGKKTRLPAQVAKDRAELLVNRLGKRMEALDAEAQISARVPLIKGGALIVPAGLLRQIRGETPNASVDAEAKKRVELLAMEAVFAAERALGRSPVDRSAQRGIGYDIESSDANGNLVFIEVKGRVVGADSVTLTFNELKCSNNQREQFRVAICSVSGERASPPVYVSGINWWQPGDIKQSTVTFPLSEVLQHAQEPH
ncbi:MULTISPECIES: helicase-related protein [unclassified Synechococcus]|uniref:helicase-related protein n=1 Tax=unclassified Synechococcus TaxID=2626047 RepID=UPI001C240EE3|nr:MULTISPECIES: helicase-related protein [unclassified Synechococcus]